MHHVVLHTSRTIFYGRSLSRAESTDAATSLSCPCIYDFARDTRGGITAHLTTVQRRYARNKLGGECERTVP